VLGERALVEYVELDGSLRALTLHSGRLALHELGDSSQAYEQLEWLRFAMTRLSRLRREDRHHLQVLARAHVAAARLDELLVAPLLQAVGDAPLVLVPTGALHALPWATLPSLQARPVTVAPSLSVWLDLAQRIPPAQSKTALIAGPRLRHSRAEVRRLARLHPDAIVLAGPAATSAATLAAIDGAALAHVACHGRFRSDSPLFSALELHDGPVTALDLQQLARPPDLLVLAACDLALSDRHPGDELLGLAAALLAMGTRTIIATVVSVPDADARRLMLALHRQLAAGVRPARALAHVTAHDDASRYSGFVCLGNG
jgi:CHAT domain-containing protein